MRTTKSRKFDVLCTDEQFLAFSQLADKRGMGLGTLARTLLLEALAQDTAEAARRQLPPNNSSLR